MAPLQVKEGHVSVYQALSQLGFTHPGKVWKQLLATKGLDFVPHTRLQFEMADGRKSRLLPAIRQEDLDRLLEGVGQMSGQGQTGWLYLPAERQVMDILTAAFQDQQPEGPCELQGVMVDLYFHRCNLAVVLVSFGEPETQRIQKLKEAGIQVVQAHVYHQDFQLGALVWELRSIVESKP
ncbi:hypothetical protein [Deinococcus cellulosilyticus]|nr:hypothetical protein [Deinococcus cellulosilyticus]